MPFAGTPGGGGGGPPAPPPPPPARGARRRRAGRCWRRPAAAQPLRRLRRRGPDRGDRQRADQFLVRVMRAVLAGAVRIGPQGRWPGPECPPRRHPLTRSPAHDRRLIMRIGLIGPPWLAVAAPGS